MSEEFTQFGDAARLYAKYNEVVDRMRKAYEDDVNAFLKALTTRLTSMMEPEILRQKTFTRTYYNWWLDGWPRDPAGEPYATLYLLSDAPRIASPGTLHVSAWVDKKGLADFREAVGSIKSLLPKTWQVVKPRDEDDGLFTVIVSYGEDKDPVAFAAKPIAELLRLMNDAIMKTGKSRRKAASR